MHIHIFVLCPTDFFWKRLFLRYVNMNIWICTSPITRLDPSMRAFRSWPLPYTVIIILAGKGIETRGTQEVRARPHIYCHFFTNNSKVPFCDGALKMNTPKLYVACTLRRGKNINCSWKVKNLCYYNQSILLVSWMKLYFNDNWWKSVFFIAFSTKYIPHWHTPITRCTQ